jgi:N-acetylmuramoyl-L-alanine amidase
MIFPTKFIFSYSLLSLDNPVNHFPTFEPSEERVAQIEKEFAEDTNPLNLHYDASKEVRAKGAGFYAFSGDEEARQRQMEELRLAREETERTRQDIGAIDVKPGDIEGMQAEGSKSRALEKRKRELEERRKLVEAKRRKIKGNSDVTTPAEPSVAAHSAQSHTIAIQLKDPSIGDPFAEVEAQSTSRDIADDFLAQLEKEMLNSKSR